MISGAKTPMPEDLMSSPSRMSQHSPEALCASTSSRGYSLRRDSMSPSLARHSSCEEGGTSNQLDWDHGISRRSQHY